MFIELADSQMAKMATELLETENPTMQILQVKVKEMENSIWYIEKKEYRKMVNFRKEKFCKPCNSKTHTESECWGPCSFCIRKNHQKKFCKFKDNANNQNAEEPTGPQRRRRKRRLAKKRQ